MNALDGDPAALFTAAGRCTTLAGELADARTLLGVGVVAATANWSGVAAARFAAEGGRRGRHLLQLTGNLEDVGAATRTFATVLQTAQLEARGVTGRLEQHRDRVTALHHQVRLAAQEADDEGRRQGEKLLTEANQAIRSLDAQYAAIEQRVRQARRVFAGQLDAVVPPQVQDKLGAAWQAGSLLMLLWAAGKRSYYTGKILGLVARHGGRKALAGGLDGVEKSLVKLLTGPTATAQQVRSAIGRRLPGMATALTTEGAAAASRNKRLLIEYETAIPGLNDLVFGRGHHGMQDVGDRVMGAVEVGGVVAMRGPGWFKVGGAAAVTAWALWRVGSAMHDHKVGINDIKDRAKLDYSAFDRSHKGQQALAKDLRRTAPAARAVAQQVDSTVNDAGWAMFGLPPIPGVKSPLAGKVPSATKWVDDHLTHVTADDLGELLGKEAPSVTVPKVPKGMKPVVSPASRQLPGAPVRVITPPLHWVYQNRIPLREKPYVVARPGRWG